MQPFLTTLGQIATLLSLQAAIICGSGIAYLLFRMPSVPLLQERITGLFPRKSARFRSRMEFALLILCGWITVHFLVHPHEEGTAFISGFSWYSLLSTRRGEK
jgi:hypothetical protein